MLRDFLRTIGSACIIAGAFLFLIDSNNEGLKEETDTSKLKSELQVLQTKLDRTEEELAHLQTATSVAGGENTELENTDEETENPTESIMKMVLIIEPGMNSTIVTDALERAGIIDDPTKFEAYLQKNNLAGKIQIGKYDLDSAMTHKTIAAIITAPK